MRDFHVDVSGYLAPRLRVLSRFRRDIESGSLLPFSRVEARFHGRRRASCEAKRRQAAALHTALALNLLGGAARRAR